MNAHWPPHSPLQTVPLESFSMQYNLLAANSTSGNAGSGRVPLHCYIFLLHSVQLVVIHRLRAKRCTKKRHIRAASFIADYLYTLSIEYKFGSAGHTFSLQSCQESELFPVRIRIFLPPSKFSSIGRSFNSRRRHHHRRRRLVGV